MLIQDGHNSQKTPSLVFVLAWEEEKKKKETSTCVDSGQENAETAQKCKFQDRKKF